MLNNIGTAGYARLAISPSYPASKVHPATTAALLPPVTRPSAVHFQAAEKKLGHHVHARTWTKTRDVSRMHSI